VVCEGQPVGLADLVELTLGIRGGEALGRVVPGDGGLAVAAHHAGGPLDRAEQMGAKCVIVVTAGRGTQPGVERAAAVVVTAPGDRMEGTVSVFAGTVTGLLDLGDGVHPARRVGLPVVPTIGVLERELQVSGGGV